MVDERIAHITCECGHKCQVLKGDEWDENLTAQDYYQHMKVCSKSVATSKTWATSQHSKIDASIVLADVQEKPEEI